MNIQRNFIKAGLLFIGCTAISGLFFGRDSITMWCAAMVIISFLFSFFAPNGKPKEQYLEEVGTLSQAEEYLEAAGALSGDDPVPGRVMHSLVHPWDPPFCIVIQNWASEILEAKIAPEHAENEDNNFGNPVGITITTGGHYSFKAFLNQIKNQPFKTNRIEYYADNAQQGILPTFTQVDGKIKVSAPIQQRRETLLFNSKNELSVLVLPNSFLVIQIYPLKKNMA